MKILNELNELCTPLFEKLENKLSRNCIYKEYILQPGNLYHIPRIESIGSFQKEKNINAFNLNSPTSGMIKDIMIKEEDRELIIIRRLIGYSYACRIVENQNPKLLIPLVTEALLALNNAYGFKSNIPHVGIYGTFQFPGLEKIYFREMEECAAFEIRLFGNATSCINKELLK